MSMRNSGPPAFQSPYMVDAKLGPQMQALNPRQRAFVDYLVTGGLGEKHYTEAAAAAGYTNSPALKVHAHRLAHDERVMAAIKEECERRLMTGGLTAATRTMLKIVEDETHKDAAKVSLAVAAMAGISPIARSQIEHKHTVDLGEQFRADCAALGYDPDKFLRGEIIDVTPQPEKTVEELMAEAGIEL